MELTVYSAFFAFSTISFFAPFPCHRATEIGFVPGILRAPRQSFPFSMFHLPVSRDQKNTSAIL